MEETTPLAAQESPSLLGLIDRTADVLKSYAEQLEQGGLLNPMEWVIPMSDIATPQMEAYCDAIAERLGRKSHAIYAICFDDEVPLERVYAVVDGHREANKALPEQERRAFARVNNRRGCLNSRCLYLGISEKASGRLRQHLVEADLKTFAVHLNHWPSDIPGNLIVKIIGVAAAPAALVSLVEDQMAREMPPILGKRGSV